MEVVCNGNCIQFSGFIPSANKYMVEITLLNVNSPKYLHEFRTDKFKYEFRLAYISHGPDQFWSLKRYHDNEMRQKWKWDANEKESVEEKLQEAS